MTAIQQHTEIFFRFYSDTFEQEMTEILWVIESDKDQGLYRIDSLPFYVPMVASNDVVQAVYDPEEKHLVYQKTVSFSGNSIIHVVLSDDATDIEDIRHTFMEYGCVSQKLNDHFFAMEVPASADYNQIKQRLDELEEQELIEYAEPCLSERHREQTGG